MMSTNPSGHSQRGEGTFVNRDDRLRKAALRVIDERRGAGLDGLVGGLACVVINTEPDRQGEAVREIMRYAGYAFDAAFEEADRRVCVLGKDGSADVLVTSRAGGANPFASGEACPKSRHVPNTRVETFVFETPDVDRYVAIQKSRGVAFLTDDVVEGDGFRFIQTCPSRFTGNSIGLIQWRGSRRGYARAGSRGLDWRFDEPDCAYRPCIKQLDHAATRVRARDRDPAILEFMGLTNYDFSFAVYVNTLNSITNVSRLAGEDFALVFTSGVSPYISDEESGPTEKYVHGYGPRVHHLAFHTEQIEETFAALGADGVRFLVDLIGSPDEGLKQTFTVSSPNTLLVNEYIYRYGHFDGFFAKSNVAVLTEVTGKQ